MNYLRDVAIFKLLTLTSQRAGSKKPEITFKPSVAIDLMKSHMGGRLGHRKI
jgi:hypothetical protein